MIKERELEILRDLYCCLNNIDPLNFPNNMENRTSFSSQTEEYNYLRELENSVISLGSSFLYDETKSGCGCSGSKRKERRFKSPEHFKISIYLSQLKDIRRSIL